MRDVIHVAQDTEPRDRLAALRGTASKVRGRAGVKGWAALEEVMGSEACKCLREWLGLPGRDGRLAPEPDGRPQIVVRDRQLRDVASDIAIAVETRNQPPMLFLRGGGSRESLVRMKRAERRSRPYATRTSSPSSSPRPRRSTGPEGSVASSATCQGPPSSAAHAPSWSSGPSCPSSAD